MNISPVNRFFDIFFIVIGIAVIVLMILSIRKAVRNLKAKKGTAGILILQILGSSVVLVGVILFMMVDLFFLLMSFSGYTPPVG